MQKILIKLTSFIFFLIVSLNHDLLRVLAWNIIYSDFYFTRTSFILKWASKNSYLHFSISYHLKQGIISWYDLIISLVAVMIFLGCSFKISNRSPPKSGWKIQWKVGSLFVKFSFFRHGNFNLFLTLGDSTVFQIKCLDFRCYTRCLIEASQFFKLKFSQPVYLSKK